MSLKILPASLYEHGNDVTENLNEKTILANVIVLSLAFKNSPEKETAVIP